MNPPEPWVLIGRVGKPIGVAGSIRVWPEGELGEIFDKQVPLAFWVPPESPIPTPAVVEARADAKGWVVRWEGYDSRESCGVLTNRWIVARRADLPEPEEGSVYWSDLIGSKVETKDGRSLGTVEDILVSPVHTILQVGDTDGSGFLIPLTEEVDADLSIAEQDGCPNTLRVHLPNGLEEATRTDPLKESGGAAPRGRSGRRRKTIRSRKRRRR